MSTPDTERSVRNAEILRGWNAEDERRLQERARFDHLFTPGGSLLAGDYGLHHLFSPVSRALRADPRFVRLCARLGLCDYWVATGRWPDCADEVASDSDFRARARSRPA